MRLLILSESIQSMQSGDVPYVPHYDVDLTVGELNSEEFSLSVFDYDVSIVIITGSPNDSSGYFYSLPKLLQDSQMALRNGRSVICLPTARNFQSYTLDEYNDVELGEQVYKWVKELGVELQDNVGTAIKPTGGGKSQVIQDYLKYAPKYHQVVTNPTDFKNNNVLAFVDDTEIVVGLEHPVEKGTLVILPPPEFTVDNYHVAMSSLVALAQRYYEKAQRKIVIGDSPDWLSKFLVRRATEIDDQIRMLAHEKEEFDKLAYVLYGTGDELEASVSLMLEKLGLDIAVQPHGSNIDLKATFPSPKLEFAIEITGTKGTIQKDSNKISQVWQHISDRTGTSEEQDRLTILANTQYHLSPSERKDEAFSRNVVSLLADKGVLLMTTTQLYELWKSVHEGKLSKEDAIRDLHSKSGLYTP